MKYMGSKSRIVGNILPIIQERLRNYNIKTYIEPFCGGCNAIDKVQCDTKIASDNHKYLIEMFKNLNQIQNLPEFITKEHYSDVRDQIHILIGILEQLAFLRVIMDASLMVDMQVLFIQKLILKEITTMKLKGIC